MVTNELTQLTKMNYFIQIEITTAVLLLWLCESLVYALHLEYWNTWAGTYSLNDTTYVLFIYS